MTMQKTRAISKIPFLLVGGEILHWETLHKYSQFTSHYPTFINVYGPTECCVDVAYKVINEEDLKKNLQGIVPIGKSIIKTYLTIRSENGTIITKQDERGELYISGSQVGAGYVNIMSDSFFYENNNITYKTGDIAYSDYNSDIVVVGRKDSQVKINGFRVELVEIESVIEKFVQSPCAVFCINENNNNKIVVFISCAEFNEKKKFQLTKYLQNVFPIYMLPHYYFWDTTVPLTTNGKADIEQLKQIFHNKSKKVNVPSK